MQPDSSLPTLSLSPSRSQKVFTRTTSSSSSSSHHSGNPSTAHQLNFPNHPFPLGKVGTAGDPTLAKRRARNLLRDYYGHGGSSEATSPSRSEPGGPHSAGKFNEASGAIQVQERLSIDSPYFDVDAYFDKLVGNSSLKSLLSTANELMSEIRELDGERQSLVYNHHHELVEASETIDKMKSSSQKLDGTLSQLQDSLSVISQLSTSLTSNKPPKRVQTKAVSTSSDSSKNDLSNKFDDGLHLSALLSLPTVLKGLLATETRAAADQLWGQWEPALRSFEEAGVDGAKQLGNECRDVLRNAKSFTS
ncbi:hypothetical protein PCANC_24052 [Puccinia coronata f. sp. avenae]|uniref:Vacuolar protein sorting-associated protein 51 homolog n=1 Tax=Puccinia coronata f. sp. avenae TaxID=200324 RepID=A0A2N5SBY8_9BASI|nr:hypothetical protein PCANC_24052 [Puccinia coronata f. sp. avenae]